MRSSSVIVGIALTIQADVSGAIWVLSNNLPTWIYSRLNVNQYNFYLWRQTPLMAIQGTKCQVE